MATGGFAMFTGDNKGSANPVYRDQWVFYSAEKVNFFVNKTDILTVSGKDTIFIFIFLKLFINTMTFEL